MTAPSILSTGPETGAPAPDDSFQRGHRQVARKRFPCQVLDQDRRGEKNDPTLQSLMTWIRAVEFTSAGPCRAKSMGGTTIVPPALMGGMKRNAGGKTAISTGTSLSGSQRQLWCALRNT